jgi:hypothetical protein
MVGVIIFWGCGKDNPRKENVTENKKNTVTEYKMKDSPAQIEENNKRLAAQLEENNKKLAAELEENKKRLTVLKKNFVYNEDEFNNIGWYTHRSQTANNSWNRKLLKANVNSSGYIYLEDQYHSSDWIFHKRIEVKIGDNIYKSEEVPTFNEDNKTSNSSDSVWEDIHYSGNKDNGIIKAIVENNSLPVKVRFIGREYYSDFTLSNKDIQAIKDSYELSELIKKVGK